MNRGNAIVDLLLLCVDNNTRQTERLNFFLMCARHMTMNDALPTIVEYQAESHIAALHSYKYIVMCFQNRMHGVVLVKVNSIS